MSRFCAEAAPDTYAPLSFCVLIWWRENEQTFCYLVVDQLRKARAIFMIHLSLIITPKAPFPSTITLGARDSIYKLGGRKHTKCRLRLYQGARNIQDAYAAAREKEPQKTPESILQPTTSLIFYLSSEGTPILCLEHVLQMCQAHLLIPYSGLCLKSRHSWLS